MPLRRHRYPGAPGYPSILPWELISALVRHVRADGRCEVPGCGIPDGAVVLGSQGQAYEVHLSVAHVDRDPSNSLDPDNLVAACQLHHRRHDNPALWDQRRIEAGQLQLDLDLGVPRLVATGG